MPCTARGYRPRAASSCTVMAARIATSRSARATAVARRTSA